MVKFTTAILTRHYRDVGCVGVLGSWTYVLKFLYFVAVNSLQLTSFLFVNSNVLLAKYG